MLIIDLRNKGNNQLDFLQGKAFKGEQVVHIHAYLGIIGLLEGSP
jgi:hypothetical protein